MKKGQKTIITEATWYCPPTHTQGDCKITGKAGFGETTRENALWQYNSMRAHDGLAPVSTLPPGSKIISKKVEFESAD